LDWLGSTRVNMSNLWLGLWDYDNLIENKPKQIIKPNFQWTQCWRIKLKKKPKKQPELICQTHNLGHETEITT
jgi:hypothetical protein